ncbi:MAG: DUF1080 domain-containing protein [Verrucomicrobia bacterium]|nr:DUF1080 domain-containing protein [Verrucomicrobiota bacterium]
MNSTITILLTLVCLATSHPLLAADDWLTLFNGKNLADWKANADPGAFTVTNGLLKAHATHPKNRGHLFYAGGRATGLERFKNFELEAVVRGEPDSNSGIFFHTDMETRDGVLHLKNGYEVQLNSAAKEKRKTGSLYDVVDLATCPVDDTQWFTVRIRVEGKHIQVWLNDARVVDYVEPENVQRPPQRVGRVIRAEGGAIALQAHDDTSTFYFKSIRIRRLP